MSKQKPLDVYSWRRCWILLLFVLLAVSTISVRAEDEHWAAEGEEHGDDEEEWEYIDDDTVELNDDEYEEVEEELYFYAHDPKSPVVEFELPDGGDPLAMYKDLSHPPPGVHRIVEYYAHWCPHCQHFKSQYIAFAKKFKDLVARQYPDTKVEVYAMSCVPFRPLCRKYGVRSYPKVQLFLAGETNGTLIDHVDLHPFHLLKNIGIDVSSQEEEEEGGLALAAPTSNLHASSTSRTTSGEDFWLPRTKKDIFQDAQRSFHFAMTDGIFVGQGPLTNSTKEHLSNFLLMLRATVPPTLGKFHNLLSKLLENYESNISNEDTWMAILDAHPPPKKTWSHACTRGQQGMGYTCGLWELFHIVSVGLVEWNNLVMVDDYPYYRSEESAEILRHFIENFFGCEVCRVHFLKAFDECAFDRCNRLIKHVGTASDWIEFPLWLFEFHNGVNQRLRREKAAREGQNVTQADLVEVQWPSRKECPMCWHEDGRWDPDNVYMFLRLTYWPNDSLSKTLREKLIGSDLNVARILDEENNGSQTGILQWLLGALIVFFVVGIGRTLLCSYQERTKTE